jgi:hypothetical protein
MLGAMNSTAPGLRRLRSAYDEHLASHPDCPRRDCDRKLKDEADVDRHLDRDHHICRTCNQSPSVAPEFPSQQALKRHKKALHRGLRG